MVGLYLAINLQNQNHLFLFRNKHTLMRRHVSLRYMNTYRAALPEVVKTTMTAALTLMAALTCKSQTSSIILIGRQKSSTHVTAEEATDSMCDIGSPTCFTTALKCLDWLYTISAWRVNRKIKLRKWAYLKVKWLNLLCGNCLSANTSDGSYRVNRVETPQRLCSQHNPVSSWK